MVNSEQREQRIKDLAIVMFFLVGAANDKRMYNSWTAEQAYDAFIRIAGIDPARAKAALIMEGHLK